MTFGKRVLVRLLLLSATLTLLPAALARPIDAQYERVLFQLCDALVATQITDPASPDCGALVCPSTNPQLHPLHSRAAEAVYPLAIAWRRTHDDRYRNAAVLLARWLIGKQQPRGAWGEAWPKYDGWAGTTADQLISLAGAYPVLQAGLTAADRLAWENAMRRAGDYIVQAFPVGNINYHPTGAVALLLAAEALHDPVPAWLAKADSLVALTFQAVNADGLIIGEGEGVDLGYNLAQSIGFLALYGTLKHDEEIRDRAATLLRTHATFVYPNGAVDNSWGTRSYKWTYESGTKTAPGVYFTFALLGDKDASFAPLEQRCFDFLTAHALRNGFVVTGPHADQHDSLTPPCLYSTFARAQSIAMALVYAPEDGLSAAGAAKAEVRALPWHRFFPTVGVAVVRTDHLMATVSVYGAISRYGRGQVSRGGAITNLWVEGFGATGFAQTSSVSSYRLEEDIHMPNETALLPLTPRAECTIDGVYYSTVFEAEGRMNVSEEAGTVVVTTEGRLRSLAGKEADVGYQLTHRIAGDRVTKEWTFTSSRAQTIRIVEPFVRDPGLRVSQTTPRQVRMNFGKDRAWTFAIKRGPAASALSCGEDPAPYWSPFPAVNGTPVVITLTTAGEKPTLLETNFGPAL